MGINDNLDFIDIVTQLIINNMTAENDAVFGRQFAKSFHIHHSSHHLRNFYIRPYVVFFRTLLDVSSGQWRGLLASSGQYAGRWRDHDSRERRRR
jgi:hypothetical protein